MGDTGGVRVLLKLVLDCDPDAVWRALHSPTALREVAMPWVEPAGFPTAWDKAEHRVSVRALGAFTVGTQAIRLDALRSTDPRESATRILRDSGGGTGGLLSAMPHLDHRMAVAPDPAGPGPDGRVRTLYRDRLIVRAGLVTPLAWYALWAFWQWRGVRLRQLAPTWAYDPLTPDPLGVDALTTHPRSADDAETEASS